MVLAVSGREVTTNGPSMVDVSIPRQPGAGGGGVGGGGQATMFKKSPGGRLTSRLFPSQRRDKPNRVLLPLQRFHFFPDRPIRHGEPVVEFPHL